MPNYNPRLIKSKRSYSINEICSLYGIDRKTCHRWIKNENLEIIEKNVNPLLIMGADLISFIKKKKIKNKIALKENEFFCMKCHRPVKAKTGSELILKTGKRTGKDNLEQFKKTGVCEVCETKVNRFLKAY
jgi:hypothetical protein